MFNDYFGKESPLHLAVIHQNLQEVARLAQNETLLNCVNGLGYTPVELARLLGRKECLSILDPAYSSINPLSDFGVDYSPWLRFDSYAQLKQVIRHCPLILRSWLGQENRELAAQYKEQLASGYTANAAVKWVDDRIGYGLFALETIPEGTFIGEYTGQVRRLYRLHPDQNGYCFHYPTRFWSLKYFAVDSMKVGNLMRFVNHSDRPNLQPQCLLDRGLLHQVFFAKRKIEKGVQLTFDYGEDYWLKRRKIKGI